MNKNILFSIFGLALAAIGIYLFINKQPVVREPVGNAQIQKVFPAKTNSEGEVQIAVTPIDPDGGLFAVTFNTHSVDLNSDMLKSAQLIDGDGNVYNATGWEGPASGHHMRGTLKFQAPNPEPKSIELILKDIGAVAERKFNWIL